MKYYINLIKNKKFGPLIMCILIFLVGLSIVVVNVKNTLNSGIENTKIVIPVFNKTLSFLTTSNIGFIILGLVISYFGLIFLPMNTPYSQNKEDYEVEKKGNKLHIKYKKFEYKIKIEDFKPNNLFFRDSNKKHVTATRGYQIYNNVMHYYPEYFEVKKGDKNEKR